MQKKTEKRQVTFCDVAAVHDLIHEGETILNEVRRAQEHGAPDLRSTLRDLTVLQDATVRLALVVLRRLSPAHDELVGGLVEMIDAEATSNVTDEQREQVRAAYQKVHEEDIAAAFGAANVLRLSEEELKSGGFSDPDPGDATQQ